MYIKRVDDVFSNWLSEDCAFKEQFCVKHKILCRFSFGVVDTYNYERTEYDLGWYQIPPF